MVHGIGSLIVSVHFSSQPVVQALARFELRSTKGVQKAVRLYFKKSPNVTLYITCSDTK